MATSTNSFARRVWAVRQALFPSFEPKAYRLQWRHATLITIMFVCVAFTMPSFPQTKAFLDSDYTDANGLDVIASYRRIRQVAPGLMWYNIAIAGFICLHLIVEPFFERGAPVWYELFWMSVFTIGEVVGLGLMIVARPDVCNFSFGPDATPSPKLNPKSSATSICSNWRGMNGMLVALILVFLAHMTWHIVVSVRHMKSRRSVFVQPITDYRWTLPKERARINETFPADIEAPAPSSNENKVQTDSFDYSAPSTDYKSTNTGEISFPSTASEDYNNYSRTAAPNSKPAPLDGLPSHAHPVVVQQSSVSDSSSIAGASETSSGDAPFSNYGRRI